MKWPESFPGEDEDPDIGLEMVCFEKFIGTCIFPGARLNRRPLYRKEGVGGLRLCNSTMPTPWKGKVRVQSKRRTRGLGTVLGGRAISLLNGSQVIGYQYGLEEPSMPHENITLDEDMQNLARSRLAPQ